MVILGIDTAGASTDVALVDDGQVLAALHVRQARGARRPVLQAVDRLLEWGPWSLADLTAVAVNIGPGSFTGIRVGLALAQGLALASGKPLVGCSAFEALVAQVTDWEGAICPLLEARKGEVYAAVYQRQGQNVRETLAGRVLAPADLCGLIQERTLFLGSGVRLHGASLAARLGTRAVVRDTGGEEVGLAVSLARVGAERLRQAAGEPLPMPHPLYVRPADARLPRHAAQASDVA